MSTVIDTDLLLDLLDRWFQAASKEMSGPDKDYLKQAYEDVSAMISSIGSSKGEKAICGKPAMFLRLDDHTVCCSSCRSQFEADEVKGYDYCPKYGEKIWY